MDLEPLFRDFVHETVTVSLPIFLPELLLVGTIVALLLGRLIPLTRPIPSVGIGMAGTVAALVAATLQMRGFLDGSRDATGFFSGLMIDDGFGAFLRVLILLFLVLALGLTALGGIPDREDAPDFYTLYLGAGVGMLLMVTSQHLLMLFLAIEMASLPSYILTGFLKGRRGSSEGSLKFVIYGAGSAAALLFGLSLLVAVTGTGHFAELGPRLDAVLAGRTISVADPLVRTLILALVLIMTGLSFKMSVIPFHFWAPDAFHAASAEVGALLSIASKAASFALTLRLMLALTSGLSPAVAPAFQSLGLGLAIVAAVTMTFGNLAAYGQTNFKRLMAYSTIAHAGYLLLPVAAVVLFQTAPAGATRGFDGSVTAVEGLLYYLAVTLFMNLAVFAAIVFVRNEIFSESIPDYQGLGAASPYLVACLAVALFSLIGLPPFGGFIGKWMIFATTYQAGFVHPIMWGAVVVAVVNTVVSLYYYVHVLKVMCLHPRPADSRPFRFDGRSAAGLYLALLAVPVFLLGVRVDDVSRAARVAARSLLESTTVDSAE